MVLVFNELSHSYEWNDNEAIHFYEVFFKLCNSISIKYGRKIDFIQLITAGTASVFGLDPKFKKWLSSTSREIKSFALSTVTATKNKIDYPYYKVNGSEGMGVAYAYENDEMLLSFISDSKWLVDFLSVEQQELIENDDIDIVITKKDICNSYDNMSIITHEIFFKEKVLFYSDDNLIKIKKEVNKGKLLWMKKEEIFPNIIFCESVKEYVENIQSGSVLKNLLERLFEYNLYFGSWIEGEFDGKKLNGNVRPESITRLREHPEFLVKCPDGFTRVFSYHCNYGFGDLRLHFFPYIPEDFPENRKCIIGYIGKKVI